MYSVSGTTITLTRGDTLRIHLTLTTDDGEPYIPQEGDVIRFAMKKNYTDDEPLIYKTLDNDTLTLKLDPVDTKSLEFGSYVYDIQLTTADGDVDTFIYRSKLKLTEEVD